MKRTQLIIITVMAILIILAACTTTDTAQNDPDLLEESQMYLENKGSDTMVNLALYWAEAYQTIYPQARISVTGGGSGTGIASLITNTVDIANASRSIKQEEIDNARENGVTPLEHIVARDAIAIIVHPDNPIDRLTLQQISDIYTGRITNWKELGGEDRPIVKLSRETNSGTHVYFLESVIRLGDSDDRTIFSADTLLLPSSEGIIAEVEDNRNAIGYDGLGYVTPEVKVLAVAPAEGQPYILPTIETVNTNQYPIARDLYLYTNGKPTGFIKDYIDWIFSNEGQEIVRELGFVPVN